MARLDKMGVEAGHGMVGRSVSVTHCNSLGEAIERFPNPCPRMLGACLGNSSVWW